MIPFILGFVYESILNDPLESIRSCYYDSAMRRPKPLTTSFLATFDSSTDPVASVTSLIDEIDSHNIILLAGCIRTHLPSHFTDRKFDAGGYDAGGNNVTYMNQFLQDFLPRITERLISGAGYAAEAIGWRPHPSHLGLRCVEFLEYDTGSELKYHTDADSIYTLVVMLSNPDKDYSGGSFFIRSDEESIIIRRRPKLFEGLLFDSVAPHGVGPIKDGKRVVLVLEFWPYNDSPWNTTRPPSFDNHGFKMPSLLRIPREPLFQSSLESFKVNDYK